MQFKVFFLLIVFFLYPSIVQSEGTELLRIWRKSTDNTEQIYLKFNDLPHYQIIEKEKRIDILFDELISYKEDVTLHGDERIVKFLSQRKNNKNIFAFMLQFPPQRVSATPLLNNTLVLDILLGNQFTKSYPELSSKLQGLQIIQQQGTGFDNPAVSSPYRDNWDLFISQYEPDITTSASFAFTSSPFPLAELLGYASSLDVLPKDLIEMANKNLWDEMTARVYSEIQTRTDAEEKKILALTLGEILMHGKRYDDAFKQLYLLQKKYDDDPVGVGSTYLLGQIRSINNEYFLSYNEYNSLNKYLDTRLPLSPFILISQIETALATSQLDSAVRLLQRDDIAYPPYLAVLRDLRYADYWFLKENFVKAYVGYNLLTNEHTDILESHPFSLNAYCNSLYRQKHFRKSGQCFQLLSASIIDKEKLGYITLKKAFSESHYRSNRYMYDVFSTIEDTYQDFTPGLRANL